MRGDLGGMELYWEGKDITRYAEITGCVHRDVSGGRCDAMELTLGHASQWYRWGPKADDEIVVTDGGFTTGTLYLAAVTPEDDDYRVIARSVRREGVRKSCATYRDVTLKTLMERCAAECRMSYGLYGLDENLNYPFIVRAYESAPAFLARVGAWEGMTVKVYGGALRGIGIAYAQARDPIMTIRVSADQEGVTYVRRNDMKYSALTIETPWAKATARDTAADGENTITFSHLPAMDAAQAGRWARGLTLMHNRDAERVTLETELNYALSAMARVDIDGGTDMDGKWLIDEAEHDLIGRRTSARLKRVIDTIR